MRKTGWHGELPFEYLRQLRLLQNGALTTATRARSPIARYSKLGSQLGFAPSSPLPSMNQFPPSLTEFVENPEEPETILRHSEIISRFKTSFLSMKSMIFDPDSPKRRNILEVQQRAYPIENAYNFVSESQMPWLKIFREKEMEMIPDDKAIRRTFFYRELKNFPVLRKKKPDPPVGLDPLTVNEVEDYCKRRLEVIRGRIPARPINSPYSPNGSRIELKEKRSNSQGSFHRSPPGQIAKDKNMISILKRLMSPLRNNVT